MDKEIIEKEIIKSLKTRLSSSLRREIGTVDVPILNTLEFTAEELKKHLDKIFPEGYNWLDYLEGILVIDHIIPCSLYNYEKYTDSEFRKCWNLRNLRLVTKSESRRKSKKMLESLIKEYNMVDLIPENSVKKFRKTSGVKTLLISETLHKELEECSIKSGIKIKHLTELAIKSFLKKIEFTERGKT